MVQATKRSAGKLGTGVGIGVAVAVETDVPNGVGEATLGVSSM